MSPFGRIRRQLERRRIAGHERSTAAVGGLLSLLAAVGLILTNPAGPADESRRRAHPTTAIAPVYGEARSRWTPGSAVEAKATADAFLHSYLAYLYGQAPASQVNDATHAFARSLENARLRVPPGIKALRPRVLTLDVSPQALGRARATALVSDTEVVRYPIRLVLTESERGWQVSELEATR